MLRFLGWLFAAGFMIVIGAAAAALYIIWDVSKDLPDYKQLAAYEPPVMTRMHAADGSLLAEYAEQRRLFVPIANVPKKLIEAYLAIEGSVTDVVAELAKLPSSPALDGARRWFEARIAALEDQGLNPRRFHFSANFGRELEYYTGLVFQIEVEARNAPLVVAGGGRYNDLLHDLGASSRVSAVGCAIHTERVKAVLS